MKQILLSVVFMCLLSSAAFGQSDAKASTDSDKQKVEKLMAEYLKAMQADSKERDKFREQFLTEDYFYMGIDGIPVTKRQVMIRQTNNQLRIDSVKTTDLKVRLYETTAILALHELRY